jgi:acetyl esterase
MCSLLLGASPAAAQKLEAIYGPQENEVAEVFPARAPDACTVVLVPGGWWHEDAGAETEALFLQKEGCAVALLDYPEASRARAAFPIQPEAIETGVLWVAASAAAYNGSAEKIVLLSGSTGGNISALACERLDEEAPGAVKGCVDLSGPSNLVTLAALARQEFQEGKGAADEFIGWALGCPGLPAGCEAAMREYSPVEHVPAAGCPPWYLAAGNHDLPGFLNQTDEMQAALTAAGCPVTVKIAEKGHAFGYWGTVRAGVLAFIRTVT